jgi:hypothetical protein
MEKSSFFNSVSGDRKYKAEDWASYFGSFIGNGVFPVPSTGLQVVAGSGMQVTVKAGKAWINGYFYNNTSDLSLTLATADGVLNRIDRIVVRWDLTNRVISVKAKSSSYSASPTAPAVERDADIYELAIADVYVGAGVTAITQSNITDRRYNTSLCGIVVGVVEQIDPSSITAQFDNFFELYRAIISEEYNAYVSRISGYESNAAADYETFLQGLEDYEASAETEFEAWFEEIKDKLGTDVAGQLAQEVQELENRVSVLEAAIENADVFTSAAWLANSYLGCAYLSTATE